MELDDIDDFYKYVNVENSCLFIIGFVGNVISGIVIFCSKSMNTLVDFYLLSLSVADVLVLITGVLNDIYFYIYDIDIESIQPQETIKIVFYIREWIFQTSMNASVLTVTAFTLERYLAICHPFVVQSMSKISRFKKIIATIWLTGAILALLPVAQVFYILDNCVYNITWQKVLTNTWPYMLYTCVIVYFALPMLMITVMYTLIVIQLNRLSKQRQIITSQADRTNKKILAMFAVIIAVFFISWAPYYASQIIRYHGKSLNSSESSVTLAFTCLIRDFTYSVSPTLNPVIYVMTSKKFREALKDLLSKSRKKLSDRIFTSTNTQTNEMHLELLHK